MADTQRFAMLCEVDSCKKGGRRLYYHGDNALRAHWFCDEHAEFAVEFWEEVQNEPQEDFWWFDEATTPWPAV